MFGLEYVVMAAIEERKNRKKLIYLAGPYTHRLKSVRNAREQSLTKFAAEMVRNGEHVWSPITESHQYSKVLGLETNWEFWKEHDLLMLSKCDELVVLMLEGWERSVGVGAEIEEAKRLNIPIRYVNPSGGGFYG
jgi:nucleoside 2-deoxyribosyltransferase